jgi:NTP pyrophosphatase (non-canonical NTP hydrolase)
MSVEKTLEFFKVAKPNPTAKDVMSQMGADTEECRELFEAFGFEDGNQLMRELEDISQWAYKHGNPKLEVAQIDKQLALDAIADKLVTAIGLAYMLNMDIVGAFNEVAESNLSKFLYVGSGELSGLQLAELNKDCIDIESQGRYSGVHWKRQGEYVVFLDGNGKIVKPSTFKEPNLEQFIGGE